MEEEKRLHYREWTGGLTEWAVGPEWERGRWLRQECHCVLLGCFSGGRLLRPGVTDSFPTSGVPAFEMFIRSTLLISHLHKHLSSMTTV